MDDKLRITFGLLFATIACVVIGLMPFGGLLIYPIKLFVTYVHEMCHAAVAILTGGSVYSITINPDESGVTMTSGGIDWLISSAGYIGTVLVGLLSIHLLRSGVKPKTILSFFVAIMVCAIVFTGLHSTFGTIWGLIIVGALLIIMHIDRFQVLPQFVASFMSIQLLFNAFYDFQILFQLSGTGVPTDALNMQHATGIPAVMWAIIWIGISCLATYKILFR